MDFLKRHFLQLIGLIGLFGAPVWKAIKPFLQLLGDFDLIISRIEDPDWMGVIMRFLLDPPGWLILVLMVIGILLLMWDGRRQPKLVTATPVRMEPWKVFTKVEPSHIIIIGLAIALSGAIWQWRRVSGQDPQVSASPNEMVAAQNPPAVSPIPSPELDKLRAQLEAKRQEAENTTRELNTVKGQLAAAQKAPAPAPAPAPVNPMQYVPKDPYQPGPIIDRKYTKKEAEQMIDALAEITEVATQIQRAQLPNEFATLRTRWGNRQNNLAQLIKSDGYVVATGRLNTFITNMKNQQETLQKTIGRYPEYYQRDLNKIVGQTGINSLLNFSDTLLFRLNELAKAQVPPDSPIVMLSLD